MEVDDEAEYYNESEVDYLGDEHHKMWGFLQPIEPEFHFMKLTKPKVLVGRAAHCDYSLCTPRITSSCMIGLYSKKHFEICKHVVNNNGDYQVYIQDLSQHGVFLNGVRIDRGVKILLRSGTTVGLCTDISKALYFVDFSGDKDPILPEPMSTYYRSGHLLGSGGFGQVFFSYSLIYNCPCATKRVARSRITGLGNEAEDIVRRELAEANLLREMKHRHIINVYDIIESKDFVYLLLEYAEGGDLYTRIRTRNKPDESLSKFYFRQVLDATKYLHSQNITHRDIKLQNMLLMSREELTVVKLADFGLSRVVGEQSLMNTLAGSPMYSPPEMIPGFRNRSVGVEYTKKVDLWSLGVSLYVLLSHYFPFSKDCDLYEQIMTGAYTFHPEKWSDISADARNLVASLLQEEHLRIDVDTALSHRWLQSDPLLEARMERLRMPSCERIIPDSGWFRQT